METDEITRDQSIAQSNEFECGSLRLTATFLLANTYYGTEVTNHTTNPNRLLSKVILLGLPTPSDMRP